MDISKLILTQPVSSPQQLNNTSKIENVDDEKKKQIAKDFEAIFVQKLFDEMHNTIGDWGMEKETGTEQIQGIFGTCLSQELANKGGMGLWKDIYQFFSQVGQVKQTQSVDNKI
jgi:Rod binding domain-containing protein